MYKLLLMYCGNLFFVYKMLIQYSEWYIYPAAKYYLTTLIWTLKEKLCNPWTILQNVNKRSSRWPRCDKNWYNGTHGMHVVQIEKGGIKKDMNIVYWHKHVTLKYRNETLSDSKLYSSIYIMISSCFILLLYFWTSNLLKLKV